MQLYDHEALIQEAACATRTERHALALAVRQEKSRPVMDVIEKHVERYRGQVLPKSPLGKALGYPSNQWTPLSQFLEDGAIPIDDTSVERQIRPIAVGRGSWTFIGSEDAGPWAARLYGLMGTCRLQGINPYAWLKDVLERVRDHPPDRMHPHAPRPEAGAGAGSRGRPLRGSPQTAESSPQIDGRGGATPWGRPTWVHRTRTRSGPGGRPDGPAPRARP